MPSLLDTLEDPGVWSSKYDCMVFADSGAGKTSLLRTCGGRGAVLYTPSKEGYSGIKILKKWRKRIKFKSIYNFDDFYKWYVAFRDENPKRPENLRYDWVAFDTATGAIQLAMQKVLSMRPKQVHGKTKITGDEWGKIAGFIDTDLVQPFKSLPISTIWLAQEQDRRGKKKHGKLGPDMTPGAMRAIRPAMDFIGRLYVVQDSHGERETRMRIGALDSIATKYRTSDMGLYVPQVIRDPHIDRLVDFLDSPAGTECPFDEVIEDERDEDEEGEELEDIDEVQPGAKKKDQDKIDLDAEEEDDEVEDEDD